MSNSLWPHELQHIRLPYPSLPPGVCSNSCPLNQWGHPNINLSLPLPVSNSSCLFTRYQPLYPSCYTILLYFSKYCTVRPWYWERLRAGGEGGARECDGWMALLIQWTWVWANSRRWWRMGKPGMLQSMGSQRETTEWLNNNKGIFNDILYQLKYLP